MGFGNKILASIISVSMVGGIQQCSAGNKDSQTMDDSENIEIIESEVSDISELPVLSKVQKNTKNQIFVILKTDDENSFTHTKTLETITDPNNTVLELPLSQLFQKYGNRPHPLAVKGIKKDFKALLGSDGIEKINGKFPQKLSHRSEGITSETNYLIDDTLRFPLINPLLKDDFPKNLSDQLKEEGFTDFSDTDSSTLSKRIRDKENTKQNHNNSDFIYDIVVKKVFPTGKSALAVYRDGELFMATYVSVGLNSRKTKTGQFQMLAKNAYYYSKKYKSPMSDGVNFDEGGFWLHQGNVTGYPASHGCVRQPGVYASILYDLVKDKKHVDIFISKDLYKSEK